MTDTPQAPAAPVVPIAPAPAAPPATPAEAATRLTALKADPKWTSALLAGGPAQTREFHSLHELVAKGDSIDQAMSGVLPAGIIRDGAQVEMTGTAEMLRELGIRDDIIREALQGPTETKAWYDETARWKKDAMSKPEWVKRLMSGDVEARRHLMLANIILTGGIKESAA
jgi:hypothetical protein